MANEDLKEQAKLFDELSKRVRDGKLSNNEHLNLLSRIAADNAAIVSMLNYRVAELERRVQELEQSQLL